MMDAILENCQLGRWATLLPRSPTQRGKVHETDAELLPLGDGRLLALTVDQVVEEVSIGLYEQAETVGRIAATASLSDLAAVGADVLGLLLTVTLPAQNADTVQEAVARGVHAVVARANSYVLGGDTSGSATLSVACTAAGVVPENEVLTRLGAVPGDAVFVTGPVGLGAALAAVRMLQLPAALLPEAAYRPELRLREGRALRRLANCCMDTSDGLIATLDQIARLNQVAIVIDTDPAALLHPAAERVRSVLGIGATPLLAAIHGEFELVFTISESMLDQLKEKFSALGITPLRVGRVVAGSGVSVGKTLLDTTRIRNLSIEVSHNPRLYLQRLLELCPSTPGT